ncbi:Response regulator protein VraR [Mucisphaera calidilacus]|uniref:Response regulator protein VraR n=1 Tax=Mucisphaera calidilacus TaxID=2527982 RepID=A0A518BZV6_9BACT|nr:Response regulator protein VraR [Mucisphaera calidilacus]
MNRPNSIVIVDDHRLVAEGISSLLETVPDLEVVAHVYDPAEIISKIRDHKPDIVLCDLDMPGGDPLDSASQAIESLPDTRLLILSAYPTDVNIERALKIGVAGFITKNESAETIVDGLHAVAAGHAIYSDEVRQRFVNRTDRPDNAPAILALSPRELTVTLLAAQGMTTPQIAKTVYRSTKTVDKQISSAMAKTGCTNRVDLSRWAIREGLMRA